MIGTVRTFPVVTCMWCLAISLGAPCVSAAPQIVPVGEGWAGNSINAAIFRRNSVVTHGDQQFVAYYDRTGRVVLGKRKLDSREWQLHDTQHAGNVGDAHNSISIMVDGAGYLHMAWNHHDVPLRYCRSVEPGSLELTDRLPMTGKHERRVSYPEFYCMPNGDLLFLFRDGESGRGNLVLNHYDYRTQKWTQRQELLVDGEGERSAYWQLCVDPHGTVHLSWVWRETYDVATNHDLCYARSTDGGVTWQRSDGTPYELPITASSAEYAARVDQYSELINSTSMTADSQGRPYIATYWSVGDIPMPQYQLVYHDGSHWKHMQVTNRNRSFSLSGSGTKQIPISRPQVLVNEVDGVTKVYVVTRDIERDSRASVHICDDVRMSDWRCVDLTTESLDMWEPTYDTELWAKSKKLHLFVQRVAQGDGERVVAVPPSPVSILEWTPE